MDSHNAFTQQAQLRQIADWIDPAKDPMPRDVSWPSLADRIRVIADSLTSTPPSTESPAAPVGDDELLKLCDEVDRDLESRQTTGGVNQARLTTALRPALNERDSLREELAETRYLCENEHIGVEIWDGLKQEVNTLRQQLARSLELLKQAAQRCHDGSFAHHRSKHFGVAFSDCTAPDCVTAREAIAGKGVARSLTKHRFRPCQNQTQLCCEPLTEDAADNRACGQWFGAEIHSQPASPPVEGDAGVGQTAQMDWQQVALNGGPPCFALLNDENGWYCGRAERWEGHDGEHRFISLDALLLSTHSLSPAVGEVEQRRPLPTEYLCIDPKATVDELHLRLCLRCQEGEEKNPG